MRRAIRAALVLTGQMVLAMGIWQFGARVDPAAMLYLVGFIYGALMAPIPILMVAVIGPGECWPWLAGIFGLMSLAVLFSVRFPGGQDPEQLNLFVGMTAGIASPTLVSLLVRWRIAYGCNTEARTSGHQYTR